MLDCICRTGQIHHFFYSLPTVRFIYDCIFQHPKLAKWRPRLPDSLILITLMTFTSMPATQPFQGRRTMPAKSLNAQDPYNYNINTTWIQYSNHKFLIQPMKNHNLAFVGRRLLISHNDRRMCVPNCMNMYTVFSKAYLV